VQPVSDVVSSLTALKDPEFDGNAVLTALKAEEREERLLKRRTELDEEFAKHGIPRLHRIQGAKSFIR